MPSQVLEILSCTIPEFTDGVDAGAAVEGKSAAHRRLENPQSGFSTSPTPILLHAIAAKICCAVVDKVGVVSFIDSALK